MNSREGITLNPLSRRAPSTGLGDASSDVSREGLDDEQDYPDIGVGGKVRDGLAGSVARVPCNLARIDGGRESTEEAVAASEVPRAGLQQERHRRHVVDQGTEP